MHAFDKIQVVSYLLYGANTKLDGGPDLMCRVL